MMAQAATTPPPAPPASAPTSGEKLISLDFKDADVVNLLRILAAESGRNIVSGDDVKGRVSISLKNVTWEQALDTILEVRSLAKVEKDGVIRIVSLDQLTKEKEAQARVEAAKRNAEIETRTKLAEAQLKETELASKKLVADAAAAEQAARGPLREEVIRLSYADPTDVAMTLQGILGIPPEGVQAVPSTIIPSVPSVPSVVPSIGGPPNPALGQLPPPNAPYPPPYGPATQPVVSVSQDVLAKGITVRANKATNSIFIRHYEADLERIKKLIREQLDVPLPQIKIEARMEILDRNALESIGVQWGG
ncbi:MAG TPA: secretin N-terminal domain-containing protein, partial [Verrucomicrobiae bacterium]|nr:secretin N-terminal domain-containing protein [Verrucomicrobiae bacterium]